MSTSIAMRRLSLTLLFAGVMLTTDSADADEVAVLVIDAGPPDLNKDPPTFTLLNRVLPSGGPIKLQVPVPGTDPTNGRVVVWPQLGAADCKLDPGKDTLQRHELGLVTSGAGDARVLEGTIPALQLDTRYCIRVVFDRRIPSDVLAAVADVIATTDFAWPAECAKADPEPSIAKKIEDALAKHLAIYPKIKMMPARLAQASITIAKLFDIDKQCKKVKAAASTTDLRASEQRAASERVDAVKFESLCVTPKARVAGVTCKNPTAIAAWPAVLLEKGAVSLAVAVTTNELEALGPKLALADSVLGARLRAVAAEGDAAKRQKAIADLAEKLSRKPASRALVLYLPSEKRYWAVTTLHDSDPIVAAHAYAQLLVNVKAHSSSLTEQLQVMRATDAAAADEWVRLLAQLRDADAAQSSATAASDAADAAMRLVEAGIKTDLKATVQTDTVKDILLTTASDPIAMSSSKAPNTDEKASWISPTVGILIAAPIVEQGGKRGTLEGWIQPFLGASIYFDRVDRVIDLDQLVGNPFWQRNSFSVGILPNKPNVHGKDISGPWNAAIVPFVGFGHRFTQYIRADIGVIPFKYADANPTISDTDWGVAVWLGASLDADVWALVAGKVK